MGPEYSDYHLAYHLLGVAWGADCIGPYYLYFRMTLRMPAFTSDLNETIWVPVQEASPPVVFGIKC